MPHPKPNASPKNGPIAAKLRPRRLVSVVPTAFSLRLASEIRRWPSKQRVCVQRNRSALLALSEQRGPSGALERRFGRSN
jgi:hypothetical protein